MAGVAAKHLINLLAGAVICGFIAVTGFSVWLSVGSRDIFGPTVLATGHGGDVYFNIAGELFRTDARGRLLERVSLGELGLQRTHLTDLLELANGTLLIGSAEPPDIHACRLQSRHCTPWLRGGNRPRSAFKMIHDDARGRLIVVDGEGHRILLFDDEGRFLAESRGGRRGLLFPNTAWLSGRDELVVADTNHHRLVALDADTLRRELWEMPVDNELGHLRRVWPTDFVHTDAGDWWTILDDDLLEHGDVVLFDDSRAPIRRIELPTDWDPIKLRARSDDVLLAGFGSVDLVSVSLDGDSVQPFGDASVRAALAGVRAVRTRNDRWWHLWIWVAIVPLGLLAIVAGWLDYRQRQQANGGPASASTGAVATAPEFPATRDGVFWLSLKPAAERQIRLAQRGLYLAPLLLVAGMLPFIWSVGIAKSAQVLGLIVAMFAPALLMSRVGLEAMTGNRLGVTRDRLVLECSRRPSRYVYPRQVVYSRHFISTGELTIYTRNGWGALYPDGEIRQYLQPLLEQARRLSAWQGQLFLLRSGDRLAWASILLAGYYAALVMYMQWFMQ